MKAVEGGMPEPSISVAMCSYNMAAFIREQLASIARQTRLPDELIVCDDGSDDETVEIVRGFAAAAPFAVRVVQNPLRLGFKKNFEQAISLCRGDVIFLCDHDDVWRERKIELLLDLMRDESVGAAFGDANVVASDLTPRGFSLWDACNFNPERRRRFAAGAQFSELLINNVVQGAAAAFKSSFRPAILPIPSAEWPHDYWIALIISAQARISFTEHRVLDYRQHGRNLIGARRPWRAPPTLLRGLGYRAGSWLKKLRSPTTYYTKQLDVARRELQSMSVLRERLMSLDQNTVGPAILLVDTELARLTHREAVIQGRMRRWTRMAPGASRASET